MRCNPGRWLWGVIPIAMLSWIAFTWERDGIETELRSAAESALEKDGFGWGRVFLEGRDAMLRGEAPDEAQPYRAVEIVRNTYGVRVVRHRTDLKTAAPVSAGQETPPEAVEAEREPLPRGDQRQAAVEADQAGRSQKDSGSEIERIRQAELEDAWRRAEEHEKSWKSERETKGPTPPGIARLPEKAAEAEAAEPAEDRGKLEEAWRQAEENEQRWRAEGESDRVKAADEAARQRSEDEAAARRAAEDEARSKEEADAKRRAEEEQRAQAEADAEAQRLANDKAAEEARAAEEADARRKAEADAAEKRASEEAEARKAEAEAAEKRSAEEAEARRIADAEAAEKRAAEEAGARKAEAEAAEKRAVEEAEARRKEAIELAARKEKDEVAAKLKTEADRCQGLMRSAMAEGVINFARAEAELTRDSYLTLDRLAAIVKACPTAHITIAGHTDSEGLEERNQLLSERRAKAVVDYLVQKGIEPDRLTSAGYGESRPIAPNDTPEGMAQNRRIEFGVAPSQEAGRQ